MNNKQLDLVLEYLNTGIVNERLIDKNKHIQINNYKTETLYVGSINKINVGDTSINNRTYFYKNLDDCLYSLVERICSKTSEPYSEVISIDIPKKLNTTVYVASVKGTNSYGIGHGASNVESYEVDKLIYNGTIKNLIKEFNIKTM
jgi:hypothetical protein